METNVYWLWLLSMVGLIGLMQTGLFVIAGYAIFTGRLPFDRRKDRARLRASGNERGEEPGGAEAGIAVPAEFSLARAAAAPLHVLSAVSVREVMTEPPAVSPLDTLDMVQETMFACEVFALPVLDEDAELCGIVSMSDVTKIARCERAHVRVAAVYTHEVLTAFPDETVHEIVERMRSRQFANLPVVSRREENKLLGMITKSDIVQAYRRVAVESTTQ